MKINDILLLLFFFFISRIGMSQTHSEEDTMACFNVQTMEIATNIYSVPIPLKTHKHKSIRFYVLEEQNLPNKNYRYRSNDFLVELFKEQRTKYQRVILANYSTDTIFMRSFFVRGLFLIQEALDSNNTWQPIEAYNLGMSCAVGEIDEFLVKPHEYLNIYVARYGGTFKTKLRLKLQTFDRVLYSNEFEGSINLGQFQKLRPQPEQWIYPSFFDPQTGTN